MHNERFEFQKHSTKLLSNYGYRVVARRLSFVALFCFIFLVTFSTLTPLVCSASPISEHGTPSSGAPACLTYTARNSMFFFQEGFQVPSVFFSLF